MKMFKRLIALILMISSVSILTGCDDDIVANVDGNHYVFVDEIYEYNDGIETGEKYKWENMKNDYLRRYVNDTIFFKNSYMYHDFDGESYIFDYEQNDDEVVVDYNDEEIKVMIEYNAKIPAVIYCYATNTLEIKGNKILMNFECDHRVLKSVTQVYKKYS